MFPGGFKHNYSLTQVPQIPWGRIIRTILLIVAVLFGPLVVIRAAEAGLTGSASSKEEMLPTSMSPGYYGYHGLMSST